MVEFHYTHIFDLLWKLARVLCGGALSVLCVVPFESVCNGIIAAGGRSGIPEIVFVIGFTLVFCVILFCWVWLLERTILPPTLPSYLYIRWILRAPLSWKEAKQIGFLFSGDSDGKWHPLKELRHLPKELRRAALISFAEKLMHNR